MELPKIVVFDVDGTLTRVESSWEYLHRQLGTWSRGKQYRAQFFHGNIKYERWAALDVALWKGVSIEKIHHILYTIPITEGVEETVETLKKKGFKVVLLSAGLSVLTDRMKKEMNVNDTLANELIVKDGKLVSFKVKYINR